MTFPSIVSAQLATVAHLRWRMFLNGLRTRRGKMELVSRVVVTSAFALGGLGGFAAAAVMSWFCVSQGKPELLAFPLWAVFFVWQVFPVMATAFSGNPESSELLRFPLTYRSYFLIRLAYGLFDPASAIGCLVSFGILAGVSTASPLMFPWALLVLAIYALFNLIVMQTVFAWLERWLAQRRTREILGVVFILFMLSFQLIGPALQHMHGRPSPEMRRTFETIRDVQQALPPGLAADALAQVVHARYAVGFTSLLLLGTLTLAIGYLLHMRLSGQFRGENLSEVAAAAAVERAQDLPFGWELPGLSPAVAAVFEKEVRYLGRSGPMLLTLVMPIFMLIVFRMGPMNPLHQSSAFSRMPDMAFPGASAYALLVLTNLVYNSFGGDGGGVQFFYASPVRFRDIVLGKNLTHFAILAANMGLAWAAVSYFYGMPRPAISIATLAGMLFAAPVNFTVGNLLSISAPRKRDFAAFGRQNVSQTSVLISLVVQIVVIGIGAAAFAIARMYENSWIAIVAFLVLAAISLPVYWLVLRRIDSIAIEKRETLIAELCRA